MERPMHYRIPQLPDVRNLTIHDVVDALELNCNRGDAMKYLTRAGRKPGTPALADVLKAWDCLTREVLRLGGRLDMSARATKLVAEIKARLEG